MEEAATAPPTAAGDCWTPALVVSHCAAGRREGSRGRRDKSIGGQGPRLPLHVPVPTGCLTMCDISFLPHLEQRLSSPHTEYPCGSRADTLMPRTRRSAFSKMKYIPETSGLHMLKITLDHTTAKPGRVFPPGVE